MSLANLYLNSIHRYTSIPLKRETYLLFHEPAPRQHAKAMALTKVLYIKKSQYLTLKQTNDVGNPNYEGPNDEISPDTFMLCHEAAAIASELRI